MVRLRQSGIEVCNVTNVFGQERPMVLAVDGEQEVLEKINAVLTEAKFGCRCCTTADEAIAAALASPPDLIVCDWNLDGENGVETCQRIKRQPGLGEVPVMFLSSAQRPDVIRRSLVAGNGVYCLRKPFAPTVLIELIDQALGVPGGVAGKGSVGRNPRPPAWRRYATDDNSDGIAFEVGFRRVATVRW